MKNFLQKGVVWTLVALISGAALLGMTLAGCSNPAASDPVYSVTVGSTPNGSVTANPQQAKAGETVTLTVSPDNGFRLKAGSLAVNAGAVTVSGSGPFTFLMPGADAAVSAVFEAIPTGPFAVTVGSFDNGTVTADKASAEAGETVTLTISPASGYRLKPDSLVVNGGAVAVGGGGNTRSFVMPGGEAVVSAEFEVLPEGFYAVTVGTFSNGSVAADKDSAEAGETVTLTISPAEGYRLKEGGLAVNAGAVAVSGSGNTYTFSMPAAAAAVSAEFEAIPPDSYSVTVANLVGGNIAVDKDSAAAGATVTLTVTPEAGYQLKEGSLAVSAGETAVTLSGEGPYTFLMPAAAVTVSAVFERPLTGTVSFTGTLRVGSTLTANVASLEGEGGLSYQWRRGDSATAEFADIAGATASTYVPADADLGKHLLAAVSRAGYAGTVSSAPRGPVLGPPPTAITIQRGGAAVTEPIVLLVGSEPVTLTAVLTPANADASLISWGKGDSSAVSIAPTSGPTATVTIVQAGAATITASASVGSAAPASCEITVTGPGLFKLDNGVEQDFTAELNLQPGDSLLAESIDYLNGESSTVGGEYVVKLGVAETVSSELTLSKKLTLTLTALNETAGVITKSGNGAIFAIQHSTNNTDEPHLRLGEHITLKGNNTNITGLVVVGNAISGASHSASDRKGKLTMLEGSRITGNTTNAASTAGGILVRSNGIFDMQGGSIDGNTGSATTGNGGVRNGGTFTMRGGSITNNSGDQGGGVYTGTDTFTMTGGTISGNTFYGTGNTYGGGVYVASGMFTMSDSAKIAHNTSGRGGGVLIANGTFAMEGGLMEGNQASINGAAVFRIYNTGRVFTKTGGTIYGITGDGDASKANRGTDGTNSIHAIFIALNSAASSFKYRDSTADIADNLSADNATITGNWDE
jgi:hypothetical protein